MSTVDKDFADRMVKCGGVMYPDDPMEPPVNRIVEYTNAWGKKAYGMTFEGKTPTSTCAPVIACKSRACTGTAWQHEALRRTEVLRPNV